jgi:hypothetical protein
LSDLLFFQNPGSTRRTKLNTHTSQDFDIEVILPESTADITTNVTFKVVASDQVSEGSRQGNGEPMVNPVVLGQETVEVIFKELVV